MLAPWFGKMIKGSPGFTGDARGAWGFEVEGEKLVPQHAAADRSCFLFAFLPSTEMRDANQRPAARLGWVRKTATITTTFAATVARPLRITQATFTFVRYKFSASVRNIFPFLFHPWLGARFRRAFKGACW